MLRRAAWSVASLVPVVLVTHDHVGWVVVEEEEVAAAPEAAGAPAPHVSVRVLARGLIMSALARPRVGRTAELLSPFSCTGERVFATVVNDGTAETRSSGGWRLRPRPGYVTTERAGGVLTSVPRTLVTGVVLATWSSIDGFVVNG